MTPDEVINGIEKHNGNGSREQLMHGSLSLSDGQLTAPHSQIIRDPNSVWNLLLSKGGPDDFGPNGVSPTPMDHDQRRKRKEVDRLEEELDHDDMLMDLSKNGLEAGPASQARPL